MTILFRISTAAVLAAGVCLAVPVAAKDSGGNKPMCETAGPQSPRDVTSAAGSNPVTFAKAPEADTMQLCNIHFHRFAEHKASGYADLAGSGEHQGYACSPAGTASGGSEREVPAAGGCEGIAAGDTVEVHWVFTTCSGAKPGKGLGACVPGGCSDPQLRVEARTFSLAKGGGQDFARLTRIENGSLAYLLPAKERVQYPGSTTGTSYDNQHCSPFQVSWSVDQACHSLDIDSVHAWCANDTVFEEKHAHGVRKLVSEPRFLAEIK